MRDGRQIGPARDHPRRHERAAVAASGPAALPFLIILAALAAPVATRAGGESTALAASTAVPGVSDTLDLFVMSQCPYGVQAEAEILRAIARLDHAPQLRVWHIARDLGAAAAPGRWPAAMPLRLASGRSPAPAGPVGETGASGEPPGTPWSASAQCRGQAGPVEPPSEGDPFSRFASLHGRDEVIEGARQVAIASRWPDRMAAYLTARSPRFDRPDAWAEAAAAAGIDSASLQRAAESPDGALRLADHVAVAAALNVRASPTLFVNGHEHTGPIRELALVRTLCRDARDVPACAGHPACVDDADCAMPGVEARCIGPGTSGARCENAPWTRVNATIVADSRCKGCPVELLLEQARITFPGLQPRQLEATSREGRRLLARIGVDQVPVLVFDSTVTRAAAWRGAASAFIERDGLWYFDPKHLGVGYFPLQRRTGGVELFVGARDPISIRAARALRRLIVRSGRDVRVDIHHVVHRDAKNPWVQMFTASPAGDPASFRLSDSGREPRFWSPGGPLEIEESRRQICLARLQPELFERYLSAMADSTDLRGRLGEPWSVLTALAGGDADLAAVDRCTRDSVSATALVRSAERSARLGIDRTPTFLVNGRLRLAGMGWSTLEALVAELALPVELPKSPPTPAGSARNPGGHP